jgi:hypothetical protein
VGDDDVEASEGIGGVDGAYAFEGEDDASAVFAYGEEEAANLRGAGLSGCAGEAGPGEEDAGRGFEALGKIGEEVGEHLALPALRAKDVSKKEPLGLD